MVPHGANVSRQHFLVPLDPFIIIDVAFFTLAKFSTVNNPASVAFLDRNHDMQAFMINNTRDCIQRTVCSIVTAADTDEVETLTCHWVLAHGVETEATHAVTPGNSACK